jgi:PEP-CTERM motif
VPTTFTFLNPLTITFSQAVSNLSLVLVNNVADTFVLRDNNGNSISAAFGFNSTNGVLTLNDTNILSATIGAVGSGWDFALSGGSYDASSSSPTPTPEPSTLIMLGTGLLGLAGVARRKLFV